MCAAKENGAEHGKVNKLAPRPKRIVTRQFRPDEENHSGSTQGGECPLALGGPVDGLTAAVSVLGRPC